jgi:hypothetical protein
MYTIEKTAPLRFFVASFFSIRFAVKTIDTSVEVPHGVSFL